MRMRLAELEAVKQTERGLVVTLGDVLFEVDRADLKPGCDPQLGDLINVLRENATATVAIEGHTDSTGARDYNVSLSQRRAEAVRTYLVGARRRRLAHHRAAVSAPTSPSPATATRPGDSRTVASNWSSRIDRSR